MKGKGQMFTYFLISNGSKYVYYYNEEENPPANADKTTVVPLGDQAGSTPAVSMENKVELHNAIKTGESPNAMGKGNLEENKGSTGEEKTMTSYVRKAPASSTCSII